MQMKGSGLGVPRPFLFEQLVHLGGHRQRRSTGIDLLSFLLQQGWAASTCPVGLTT
jgi:hypothetical protein